MAEFGQQFYEDDEAEQILRLAATFASPMGAMSRERLLSTAAELGISPEAVEMAERQLATQKTENIELAEFDAQQKREFYGHMLTYCIVNGFLVTVNVVTSPGYIWAIWPILAWAVGLAFHAAETFFKNSEGYREEFAKWKVKRERRPTRPDDSHTVLDNCDFVIDKYVHKRLDRGRDINRIEAIRYLREKTDMSLRDAKDAVEQYIIRNPGLME